MEEEGSSACSAFPIQSWNDWWTQGQSSGRLLLLDVRSETEHRERRLQQVAVNHDDTIAADSTHTISLTSTSITPASPAVSIVHIPLDELKDRLFELPPRQVSFAILIGLKDNPHSTLQQLEVTPMLSKSTAASARMKNGNTPKRRLASSRKISAVIPADREETWQDAAKSGLQVIVANKKDSTPVSAAQHQPMFRPEPRLWQPDPLVERTLLPLLKKELLLRHRVESEEEMQIWDLGSGVGRDVVFLAEELRQASTQIPAVFSQISPSTPQSTVPAAPFRVVGLDQRYRDTEINETVEFWKRRRCETWTECRCANLSDVNALRQEILTTTATTTMQNNTLRPAAVKCLYAVRYWKVDISQQFNSNVQDLWLVDGLPISTYLPEAPYGIGASLPTAFYNLNSHGLDQVAVRKAIAIAVDYPTIIANAMTDQSATFDQVPRSLMNPTPGEQALYDHDAVADLQWAGNDIEGAKALLDEAGIVDTDGDGWREFEGEKLSYIATCPNGWSDWQAAIEVVAAAGAEIGIDITTNFPEWGVYNTIVTVSDAPLPEGYDIFMMWSNGAGPSEPWGRIRNLISSEWVGMASNWNGNWGQYSNPEADALIKAIPGKSDEAKLKEMYTELVRIYLTDIPSFTLMYRPDQFHTVNESVWTNFPHADDGTNPPVPPMVCEDGYGVACLYNLELVNP